MLWYVLPGDAQVLELHHTWFLPHRHSCSMGMAPPSCRTLGCFHIFWEHTDNLLTWGCPVNEVLTQYRTQVNCTSRRCYHIHCTSYSTQSMYLLTGEGRDSNKTIKLNLSYPNKTRYSSLVTTYKKYQLTKSLTVKCTIKIERIT
jgi:hypothetical protein